MVVGDSCLHERVKVRQCSFIYKARVIQDQKPVIKRFNNNKVTNLKKQFVYTLKMIKGRDG